MKVVEPGHHVELRRSATGMESVVFAFPYRADVVEAVRGIPGRRFDWEAKEWWAPRADATAPYVQRVIERHDWLTVAPEVSEWLSRAVSGWVGRVTTGRRDGKGVFLLETVAGELESPLAGIAEPDGPWLRVPFSQEVADALLEAKGARLDPRAQRCASRLQVGLEPAPATLTLVHGVAEPRFTLDVNWDADVVHAFLQLPACEAHGRTLPVDAYLVEPLDGFLRTFGVEVAPNARETLDAMRREHDSAIDDVRRSRASTGPELEVEPRLGGELRPFQRAGVAYVLRARRAFLADEQGLGKTVQALAALEADDAFPAIVVCPASLKLNWMREIETWLPHRTATLVSGTGKVPPSADITVLNYEIVHAHSARLTLRAPKAVVLDESHYVKNPRAKRTQAVRRLVGGMAPDGLRLALTGTPVLNHAEELIPQLRILGCLDTFGSGARFARRFQGIGAEERIHWHLRRTCFVRRLKADVLPQLPAKRQVVVPVALDNEREYRLAEKNVVEWLREQPMDLRELEAKVAAALRAERLAQLNALKRLAANGKLGAALSWIHDFLESGEPLVVFSGNREVQERLVQRFPDALHVLGSDTQNQRDASVRAFQEPDGPQLILCATRVAGQGITLTRASNVAFLDLEWTPAMHDQAEDRCHRIGQHDAVTAWYLLAAQTIDETMIELISRKRGIVGAVTDGRRDDSEGLVEAVVNELRSGKPLKRLRVAELAQPHRERPRGAGPLEAEVVADVPQLS